MKPTLNVVYKGHGGRDNEEEGGVGDAKGYQAFCVPGTLAFPQTGVTFLATLPPYHIWCRFHLKRYENSVTGTFALPNFTLIELKTIEYM